MQCQVRADGSLTGCVILEECPLGLGFGVATLKSAPLFRMQSRTADGRPVEGGHVVIPLSWRLGGGPPPPKTCSMAAASPAADVGSAPPIPPQNPASAEAQPLALFPDAAKAKNVGGRTRMKCAVQEGGTLTDCELISECPAGLGFGRAALQSARYFKMRPKTVDGRPVAGGTVVVPMTWKLEGAEPPAECLQPTPPSSTKR